ncbi:unnamed protein product [Ceratitis capitata]|uniref:(Mediterranean fruit fly) hypothetical protein n=1 Tax=Ceratitis capitata TaxID=7213 RepID=A0A811UXF2_CERCA|nr:unnamed protein product [Ceratitis capitata]
MPLSVSANGNDHRQWIYELHDKDARFTSVKLIMSVIGQKEENAKKQQQQKLHCVLNVFWQKFSKRRQGLLKWTSMWI